MAAEVGPVSVILNPAASGGKGRRLQRAVEDGLRDRGISYSLRLTQGPGHAREMATDLSRDGVRQILVVGGDGTIHEVANGLLRAGGEAPALAIAPVGTGNDYYRVVGAPRRLASALDLLTEGRVVALDVGRVRFAGQEAYFVNLLGIGLDVEVLKRRSAYRRLSGLPQYLAALLATLVSFRSFGVQITFDGGKEAISGATILSGLTVGPSIGGGFLISPEASAEDGLLDLFLVEPLGPLQIARYIPRVIRGTHGEVPEFHLRQVKEARFSRTDGEPFFFELDGELMPDPVTALEIEVWPEALPVVLPRRPA
ncbi:MAG: diacylglycerol/lipid kinase family protein [Longimicrobiales bacterium]